MKPKLIVRFFLAALFTVPWCGALSAQTSSQLEINSVETLSGDQVRITFSDTGTGATEYEVQFSPVVGPEAEWTPELETVSNVATFSFSGDNGFFRIFAVGGTGGTEVVASFDSDSITINESDGNVNIRIVFNQSFQGTLFYTVGGSATSEDISPLSGEVQVNGLSATINVQLLDNVDLNELRYLTLDLSAGAGYAVGNVNQANLIIQDDDTLWSGNFQENRNPVSFTLKLLEGAGGLSGLVVGNGNGIFPDGEFTAQISRTDTTFSLSISSVPLPADSSMFDTAALLSLTLAANENTEGQSVDEAEIEGEAVLSLEFPSQPQLDTTLSGPFLMIQEAIRPSGKQVELSSN